MIVMPRHIVCLTFDFDTQSGFIARGMTSPTPLSRGEFGAMASRRILDLLASRGIRATWFIPGFTIETWPRECSDVVAGGHEVAHHSWAHIPPATQTRRRGGGRSRSRQRCHRQIKRTEGARLSLTLMGSERTHYRPAAEPRLRIRFEPDGRRLSALSRARAATSQSLVSRFISVRRRR